MRETEIRFKLNKDEADKILSFAKGWRTKHQKDVYYKGNFKGIVRVRQTKEKEELCFKCFNPDGGWDEIEVGVDYDNNELPEILKRIGLRQTLSINKNRQSNTISFENEKIEINIDEIEELGLFCEMEVMDGEESVLIRLAKELGFKHTKIIKKGYVQLMEELCLNKK